MMIIMITMMVMIMMIGGSMLLLAIKHGGDVRTVMPMMLPSCW